MAKLVDQYRVTLSEVVEHPAVEGDPREKFPREEATQAIIEGLCDETYELQFEYLGTVEDEWYVEEEED
jgi:hypothetical protein